MGKVAYFQNVFSLAQFYDLTFLKDQLVQINFRNYIFQRSAIKTRNSY